MRYTFTYDAYGYMLYLDGKPLGGVGTQHRKPKHWRHRAADMRMFAEDARREIAALERGQGQSRFVAAARGQ